MNDRARDQKSPEYFLLRAAGELAYRTASTRRYINDAGSEQSARTSQINEIRRIIREAILAIEDRLGDTVLEVSSLPTDRTKEKVEVLTDQIRIFSRLFTKIHEFLFFLPHQTVAPEAVSLVEASFAELYEELQKPTVILGSLFNALEFDFLELMQSKIPDLHELSLQPRERVVLQLALCDRSAPPAWAILAHEMGHAIDQKYNISKDVVEARMSHPRSSALGQILSSWCAEVSADLIAAKAMGPAPILALLSAEYAVFPPNICHPSWTHPTTKMRLDIVRGYLRKQGGDLTLVNSELAIYSTGWELCRANSKNGSLENWARLFNVALTPMADAIIEKVDSLAITVEIAERHSLDRCLDRLRKSCPISAQGSSREELREKIASYREFRFSSPERRAEAFQDLTEEFKEIPLPFATILLACYERRHEILHDVCSGKADFVSGEAIRYIGNELVLLDNLVAQSISMAMIHRGYPHREKMD